MWYPTVLVRVNANALLIVIKRYLDILISYILIYDLKVGDDRWCPAETI